MITLVNYDSTKNNILLKQAWNLLKDKTKLNETDLQAANNGKTQFSDFAHYLSYIEELNEINPKYLMLPIDETPFRIDANERTITVPPAFEKCGGVQSDNYAEIITFTIDRYFDYQDLSNVDIAVQWINETTKVEGISMVQLIDLDTFGEQNLIRFGWPLTGEMTAAAGNLTFAVRFFTLGKNPVTDNDEFKYILNTLPKTITIKPTLSVDINDPNICRNYSDAAVFKHFVMNRENPAYTLPTPIQFTTDVASFGKIDPKSYKNNLVLTAEAITADENDLIYKWYRIHDGYKIYNPTNWPAIRPLIPLYEYDGESNYVEFVDAWPKVNPGNLYEFEPIEEVKSGDIYETKIDYVLYQPKNWPDKKPEFTKFYTQTTVGGVPVYAEYAQSWPIYVKNEQEKDILIKDEKISKDTPTTLNTTLYITEHQLEFKTPKEGETNEDILGRYYVEVTNKNTHNQIKQGRSPADLLRCIVPGPKDIVIETDLPTGRFLDTDASKNTFTIATSLDDYPSDRTYSLMRVDTTNPQATPKEVTKKSVFGNSDENKNIEFNFTQYGKYYIVVDSKLNRHDAPTQISKECTIYDEPIALNGNLKIAEGLTKDFAVPEDLIDKGEDQDFPMAIVHRKDATSVDECYKFTVDISTMKNNTNNASKIQTITYHWQEQEENGSFVDLDPTATYGTEDTVYGFEQNGEVLIVRARYPESKTFTYKCIISNTIVADDGTEKTAQSDAYVFVVY